MDAAEFLAGFITDLTDPADLKTDPSISQVGTCREQLRRSMSGALATDAPDKSKAQVGTWIHHEVLRRRKRNNPHLLVDLPESPLEVAVTLTTPFGKRVQLIGHPDEIDPTEPAISDVKSKGDEADIAYVRRHGVDQQQRFQRHLYAAAAIESGLVSAEGLIVRNVFLAREGSSEFHVDQEPYDPQIVAQAADWLDDVLYALDNNEPASKDKPREWCFAACPYASDCRGADDPVEQIDDAEIVEAIRAYKQANDEIKALTLIKDGAAALIPEGLSGRVGDLVLRSVWVNASHVSYDKKPYWRRDIRDAVKKAG